MSKLLYFRPRHNSTSLDKQLLKMLPKSRVESGKANTAEKMLSEKEFIYYLALAIAYNAYKLLPELHQEYVKNLIDLGILDEIAVRCHTDVTDSCVTDDERFIYEGIEYDLPAGYVPLLRYIENGEIFVEAIRNDKRIKKTYRFVCDNGHYHWVYLSTEN